MNQQEKADIIGRLLVRGQVLLESPMIISSGEKSDTDILVLKDTRGNPYIPATAMVGGLRHYFFEQAQIDDNIKQLKYFWGSDKEEENKEETFQSSLFMSDLTLVGNASIVIRDGIKIDEISGIAEDKKKFNYEVVEPGAVFNFKAEVVLRECFNEYIFLKVLSFIIKTLGEGKISLGSMTTKGFGRCRLDKVCCLKYDFKKKDDVIAWLEGNEGENIIQEIMSVKTYREKDDDLTIDTIFKVKNSIIIKSYSSNPKDPDMVHITSNGKDVIPGTSIKGAIRARAERIINTLGFQGESVTREVFGWADDDKGSEGVKIKSRFFVEETIIGKGEMVKEVQNRVKIDRFTGGVIKSALFDEVPIWPVDGTNNEISIHMKIKDYKDWEAGLILLVLKDLWNGDLPIGGEKSIGRGILQGLSAKLKFKDKVIEMTEQNGNLKINEDDREYLEQKVNSFLCECENRKVRFNERAKAV